MNIVRFDNVSKIYTNGDHELRALDHVSFTLDEGRFVVILGPSGAGKSTLLNLLGGLDNPTEGTISVAGADISGLTENELADYRAATVGFVFQFYNLIPTLTVYENVKLVSEISKNALDAGDMIGRVGLLDHMNNFPSELSGGVPVEVENGFYQNKYWNARLVFLANVWEGKAGTRFRFTADLHMRQPSPEKQWTVVLRNPEPLCNANVRISTPQGDSGPQRYVIEFTKPKDFFNYYLLIREGRAGEIRFNHVKIEKEVPAKREKNS